MGEVLALFPLGTVLFPGAPLPLHVFEPRYRALVDDLLTGPPPRQFGIVAIREGHEVGTGGVRALYDVGCVAELARVGRLPDGRFALVVVGRRRFRVGGLDHSRPYLQAEVRLLDEPPGDPDTVDTRAAAARTALRRYLEIVDSDGDAETEASDPPGDPTALSYAVAAALRVDLPERQALLEAPDTARRLQAAADLLSRELALIRGLRVAPLAAPPLPPHQLN